MTDILSRREWNKSGKRRLYVTVQLRKEIAGTAYPNGTAEAYLDLDTGMVSWVGREPDGNNRRRIVPQIEALRDAEPISAPMARAYTDLASDGRPYLTEEG